MTDKAKYRPLEPVQHSYDGRVELSHIKVRRGQWIGVVIERPDKVWSEERHVVEISVGHDGTVKIRASKGTPQIEHWEDSPDGDA